LSDVIFFRHFYNCVVLFKSPPTPEGGEKSPPPPEGGERQAR
jgi:hypothetical protein